MLRLLVAAQSLWLGSRRPTPPLADDRGQATAEYALVLVGVAAIALLIVAWATDSNKIGELLDSVLDSILDKVT